MIKPLQSFTSREQLKAVLVILHDACCLEDLRYLCQSSHVIEKVTREVTTVMRGLQGFIETLAYLMARKLEDSSYARYVRR